MFGSFLPSRLVGFSIHQLYSGIGADIVMESITLIERERSLDTGHVRSISVFGPASHAAMTRQPRLC